MVQVEVSDIEKVIEPVAEFIPAPVKKKLKEYWITFHTGAGNDNSDIPISHNHVTNLYKRNEKAKINENFLSVLKDAVISTTIRDENGKEKQITIMPYTYTVEVIEEG
jgi:hypothetical protein